MKNRKLSFKKLLALLMVLCITASSMSPSFAAGETETQPGNTGVVETEMSEEPATPKGDVENQDVEDSDQEDEEPDNPINPDDPVNPDDPITPEEEEESYDETSGYNEDTVEQNESPDQNAKKVKLTKVIPSGTNGNMGTRFYVSGMTGAGLCAYDGKMPAKKGATGWLKRLTPENTKYYRSLMKTAYYGLYKKQVYDGVSFEKLHSIRIHFAISYWLHGSKSIRPVNKKNLGPALKYVKHFTSKKMPPSSINFEIYEWIPTAPNTKKQSVFFYRLAPDPKLTVRKVAADTKTDFLQEAPNNYSLEGAVYTVYTDENCTTRAKDSNGNLVSFTTNSLGNTTGKNMKPGRYYIKETKASKGFLKDSDVYSVRLTAGNDATFTHTEIPTASYTDLKIEKKGYKNLWRKCLGAEYTISYYDVDPSTTSVNGLTPKRQWTFRSIEKKTEEGVSYAGMDLAKDTPVEGSSDFYTLNGKRVIPVGVYTLQETKAPIGLMRNKTVYMGKVYQPTNGVDAKSQINGDDMLQVNYAEPPNITAFDDELPVRITLRKKDAETGNASAQGKGSLAGAEYKVYFEAAGTTSEIGTITTDENGYGEMSKDKDGKALKQGKYFIQEVKASPGYVVDAFYYEQNPDGNFKNGQHILETTPYETTENELVFNIDSPELVHRTLIHKTDITGGIEELPGATLQVIDEDNKVIEEWVSTEEPYEIIGLKDGTYTLREITAPFGYDVAEDVTFEIVDDKVQNEVHMDNKLVELETTATDKSTSSHVGTYKEIEEVVDIVKYKNLRPGHTYTVKGILMDKETGEPLLDNEGNKITSEKKFTAPDVNGEVELTFTFNSTLIKKGTSAVAFEDLYNSDDIKIAVHADLEDEDQTIHYPEIVRTVALEKNSGDKNVLAGTDQVIIDTVYYNGLIPGQEYKLRGELFNKTTGERTGVVAEKTFIPEAVEGTVDLEITGDLSAYEGHNLVVYEELIVNDEVVDKHEDPEDEDQTTYVPKIRTRIGKVDGKKVTDYVTYENLIPGKTYIVKGHFVDKKGKPITGSAGMKMFVPEEAKGEIEVVLNVGTGSGTLVAFEECYIITEGNKETLVGEHKDINDTNQYYEVPKPPQTGDRNLIGMYGGLFILSAGLYLTMRKIFMSKR